MQSLGKIGAFVALAGILSVVLHFVGYNLKILMWIDAWGEAAGWGIRVGLIVLGGVLYLVSQKAGQDEPEQPSKDDKNGKDDSDDES